MNKDYQIELEISILEYLTICEVEVSQEVLDLLEPKLFSTKMHKDLVRAIIETYNQETNLTAGLIEIEKFLRDRNLLEDRKPFADVLRGSLEVKIRQTKDLEKLLRTLQQNYSQILKSEKALQLYELTKNPLATKEDYEKIISEFQLQDVSTEEKRLRLEIGNYISETNNFKRVNLKRKIQSRWGLNNSDFYLLSQTVENEQESPQKNIFIADEFFELDYNNYQWICPGLVPLGELMLFAGGAKVGKSNLVADLVASVLSGTKFLGEKTRKARILYGACDESMRDLQRRFLDRGIDLIDGVRSNLSFMTDIRLNNLQPFVDYLRTFQPELVIIDNLTTIAESIGISENDVAFVNYLTKLKKVAQQHKCTILLIHHENKDPLAKSVNLISGHSRIISVPSEIWQIQRRNKDNEADPNRVLNIVCRGNKARKLALKFNERPNWGTEGILQYLYEIGDEDKQKQTQGDKILEALQQGNCTASQLKEATGIGRSIYTLLDRLETKGLIGKQRSKTHPRSFIYHLSKDRVNDMNSQQNPAMEEFNTLIDPPPLRGKTPFC